MGRERNEQYPSMPAVGWNPTPKECAERRSAVEFRNLMIGEEGAARGVAASRGGSIGAGGKKEAKPR